MRIQSALAALVVLATPLSAQTLTPYDVFIFNNFTLTTSEVNGRIAVGGNALLQNFRIGHRLTPGYSDYALTVGGNLTTDEGSVAEGRTYVGGTYSGTNTGFPPAYPPEVGGPSPFNFAGEQARVTGISDFWANLAPTGSAQWYNGNELIFVGNSSYNVFSVTMAQLQAATGNYQFNTPLGSASIINVLDSSPNSVFQNVQFWYNCAVPGDEATCDGGTNENTPQAAGQTVWNFNEQTNLYFGGPVHGNILAPYAYAFFDVGDVVGDVIVADADAYAEFYSNHDFNAVVPDIPVVTPEPATFGLMAIGLVGIAVARRRKRAA